MKQLILSALSLLLMLSACKKESGEEPQPQIPTSISGLVEKGPFVAGSEVEISELDNAMKPTGKQFSTTISSHDGAFSLDSVGLASPYVEITVNGYFYNEVQGGLSSSPISLSAIADVNGEQKVNVNLLTHLEKKRVKHLVESGKSFAQAKETVHQELPNVFGLKEQSTNSESISLTGGDEAANMLLAISAILLGNNSEAHFTEQLQWFITDFESDGIISDTRVSDAIKTNSTELKHRYRNIKANLKKRYADLGKTIEPGDFENYIDFDGDGTLYGDEEKQDAQIVQTEAEARDMLAQCYELTKELSGHTYVFDALFTGHAGTQKFTDDWETVIDHTIGADNSKVEKIWNDAYAIVYKSNNILTGIAEMNNIAALNAEKLTSQARAIRANAYLTLTSWFGSVPFDLNYVADGEQLPSNNPEKILEGISNDLKLALTHFPDLNSGHEAFIFNKETAQILLLRTYMLQQKWSEAKDLARQLINNGTYQLSVKANIFKADSREIYTGFAMETDTDLKHMFTKGDYVPFARHTEALLRHAECCVQTGNTAEAVENLNSLINRSKWDMNRDGLFNNDDLAQAGGTIQDLKNTLCAVWRYEYGREGQEFATLKRFNLVSNLNINTYQQVLPIPKSAMESNPNLQQNPGY